jgi:hypothetical protein
VDAGKAWSGSRDEPLPERSGEATAPVCGRVGLLPVGRGGLCAGTADGVRAWGLAVRSAPPCQLSCNLQQGSTRKTTQAAKEVLRSCPANCSPSVLQGRGLHGDASRETQGMQLPGYVSFGGVMYPVQGPQTST